jgi:hypothetical protein
MRWRWFGPAAVAMVLVLLLAGGWSLSGQQAGQVGVETWTAYPVVALLSTIAPDDDRWNQAPPLHLPLHAGSHGPPTAEEVELRALYDEATIAFRARWRGPAAAQMNERFVLIWHKDDLPEQRGQDCATACHVARSGSRGDIQAVVPSFVPAGREEPLSAQAIWRDGLWTLTWSRPLRSPEARDIQFVDLSQRYRVRAKVFLDLDHKPDLLTEDTYLTFGRLN